MSPAPLSLPREPGGHIALVGAGPGARDLLTFRAATRIAQADVIFYDRLVDPAVLDIARPQADRIYVGKAVGANAWPQDRICALIVAQARQGHRVVRLKSGDPGLFGRAEEELAAARQAGIPVEIVPGVTAASAAAAALGEPLTKRGETERVVLATATCRDGDGLPDLAACAQPGTTLALYMATRQLDAVHAALADAGWPPATRVTAVASASCDNQKTLQTTLGAMRTDIPAQGIANPAILFVTLPKPATEKAGAANPAPALLQIG
ncbi:uroporphyrinogen-III C-methyltransferase [Thalassococcus sp. CAU 1522]|uniref:uroporphyrinogen-III C-methyltransferase n=1 Tax=Thalassococcus arenae TaxID=2851652 RepID=A0ABS6N9C4_9RHOB|nr:uroporphyrinogen-III C-methyltransferase [Thalassococcus arenae]MBV2360611.1 uroporphyrinogen-III C-methyltransferase [Thalassococcus arenae]